ncbi:Uncharacterized protein APZ42_004926 [Daphnia magna]|uniref:Uncharacterized protein n=1 Tax=Daphnia magna TaxID=35525 RepID=A0A164GRJ0_9CRUS|nr:Uncharacterized protein APZ42_004926 [Daphnia magna]
MIRCRGLIDFENSRAENKKKGGPPLAPPNVKEIRCNCASAVGSRTTLTK